MIPIREKALEKKDYVIALRREFHMHPELSLKEERTSRRIREELEKLGIPCEVVGHGNVVGRIDSGRPGKGLIIRADIDALPVCEELDLPFRSQNPGVMHACGHDAHMSCLLGTAALLSECREAFCGHIYVVFQVGEEIGEGACEVVEYLKEKGDCDSAIGMHVAGVLKPGVVELREGARFSGADIFHIEIRGRGGHGSQPYDTIDPIKCAVDIYNRLITIPVNHHNMFDTCIVSPCRLQAGERFNIIPDKALIEGSIRYYRYHDNRRIMELIRPMCEHVAASHGCTVTVRNEEAVKCPIVNDKVCIDRARKVAESIGLTLDDTRYPSSVSDNFAEFLEAWPGFYMNFGVQSDLPDSSVSLHSSSFALDENALPLAVAFFSAYAITYLQEENGLTKL